MDLNASSNVTSQNAPSYSYGAWPSVSMPVAATPPLVRNLSSEFATTNGAQVIHPNYMYPAYFTAPPPPSPTLPPGTFFSSSVPPPPPPPPPQHDRTSDPRSRTHPRPPPGPPPGLPSGGPIGDQHRLPIPHRLIVPKVKLLDHSLTKFRTATIRFTAVSRME